MPFKFRLFYRFSLFTHKILNNHILHNIFSLLTPTSKATHNLRDSSRNIFQESKVSTKDGSKRISYILALFVNKVLRHSFNLNSKDFKLFVLENSFSKVNLFSKFSSIFSFWLFYFSNFYQIQSFFHFIYYWFSSKYFKFVTIDSLIFSSFRCSVCWIWCVLILFSGWALWQMWWAFCDLCSSLVLLTSWRDFRT